MATYVCPICGYTYDETLGRPKDGIAPGTLGANVHASIDGTVDAVTGSAIRINR